MMTAVGDFPKVFTRKDACGEWVDMHELEDYFGGTYDVVPIAVQCPGGLTSELTDGWNELLVFVCNFMGIRDYTDEEIEKPMRPYDVLDRALDVAGYEGCNFSVAFPVE